MSGACISHFGPSLSGLIQKQAKWLDRAERGELELHYGTLTQRKLFQMRMRLIRVGEDHDQHDPAFVRLEAPLVDFAREIEAGGLSHFRRQDRAPRCRRPFWRNQ